MLMGLLGTGFSALEGHRRQKILRSNIAAEQYRTGLLEDYINRNNGSRAMPFGLSGTTGGIG
jgi:hypothetical protein